MESIPGLLKRLQIRAQLPSAGVNTEPFSTNLPMGLGGGGILLAPFYLVCSMKVTATNLTLEASVAGVGAEVALSHHEGDELPLLLPEWDGGNPLHQRLRHSRQVLAQLAINKYHTTQQCWGSVRFWSGSESLTNGSGSATDSFLQ